MHGVSMSVPELALNVLPSADGSASYRWQGYSIAGTVNGPVEPQRRDELPEEAVVEVHVREASGPGGTRERYLESIIASTLRSIIITQSHPRTLIQITLQILRSPEAESSSGPVAQFASHIRPLPHLLHTALFSLLDANIPLSKTYTATTCAFGQPVLDPSRPSTQMVEIAEDPQRLKSVTSIHAFAISSNDEILMLESEGRFSVDELNEATQKALSVTAELNQWLRNTLAEEIKLASKWRELSVSTNGQTHTTQPLAKPVDAKS